MKIYVLKVWKRKADINKDLPIKIYLGDDVERLRRMVRLIHKIAPGLITVIGGRNAKN